MIRCRAPSRRRYGSIQCHGTVGCRLYMYMYCTARGKPEVSSFRQVPKSNVVNTEGRMLRGAFHHVPRTRPRPPPQSMPMTVYGGFCQSCQKRHEIRSDALSESLLVEVVQSLREEGGDRRGVLRPGRTVGVMTVRTKEGLGYLKAYSGGVKGEWPIAWSDGSFDEGDGIPLAGWVPSIIQQGPFNNACINQPCP